MTEVWLHSNRRVLALALAPVALALTAGIALSTVVDSAPLRIVGGVLAAAGAALAIGLLNQFRLPRIAYRDGDVLFYLRAGKPVAVPAEAVEAFFLGQGPAYLPLARDNRTETINLVARISQKAPEWTHVEVKPALGHWCEGYVTIRGTWCEPLNGDVIRRLNSRLRELQSAAKTRDASQDK